VQAAYGFNWLKGRIMEECCKKAFRLVAGLAILVPVCGACGDSIKPAAGSRFLESAAADLAGLPDDVLGDSRSVFLDRDNMLVLLLAGGGSIAMHQGADANIDDYLQDHRAFDNDLDEPLNIIGGPAFHFAAAGLWYAVAADSQNDFNKQRAWAMIRALSLTGVTTLTLKAVRNNDTPNGKSWAWPSGHTSSSFAAAAVLDEFYGPKVGIPAYGLASAVAWRMMDTQDHWASDILFGAALGLTAGRTVAGEHRRFELGGFQVLPYRFCSADGGVGLAAFKRF
jgi:membrane-associated phospholipid phosphatase